MGKYKRLVYAISLPVFLSFLFVASHAQNAKASQKKDFATSDVEQIKKLERDWIKAEDFLDTVAIAKILDKTFISIEANGLSNREEELAGVYETITKRRKEGFSVDSFRIDDFTVNLYGTTAVATFVVQTSGKAAGTPFLRRTRMFDVLVKRAGQWKGVASHVIRGLPVETKSYLQVKAKSEMWSKAYNNRDSTTFYTLLDSSVIMTSGGARQVGKEECKSICRRLWRIRPDITWDNNPTTIDVNEQWGIANEAGNWTESWTEKGDKERSTIKGKYAIMWKKNKEQWVVSSAIFTPLSCTGSYCNK